MVTKVMFWFSNFLFDSAMFKHSNSIAAMNSPEEKMAEEIPSQRKDFGNLESSGVHSKRKGSKNIIPYSVPVQSVL